MIALIINILCLKISDLIYNVSISKISIYSGSKKTFPSSGKLSLIIKMVLLSNTFNFLIN